MMEHRTVPGAHNLLCLIAASACVLGFAVNCVSHQEPIIATATISTPVTARELVEARGLSGLVISPDGQYAVMRVDGQDVDANTTLLEWRVIRVRDGKTVRVVDGGPPRWSVNGYIALEAPQWSPDGEWVYFRKLTGEELQLWRFSREGESEEQVSHDASDVQAFIVDEAVHYAVGPATREEIKAAETAEYDSGVLLDETIIKGFPIAHSFPVNGRMATYRRLPNAMNMGRATLLGDTPLRVVKVDADRRKTTPASGYVSNRFASLWEVSVGGALPFDPNTGDRLMSYSAQRIAHVETRSPTSAEDPQTRARHILSWQDENGGGASCLETVCTEADEIAVVGWSDNEQELYFQSLRFETVTLNAWEVASNTVRTIVETEGVLGSYESGSVGECQLAKGEAVCIAAAADVPPQLVAINLMTGTSRKLFDPNPELLPNRLGTAQRITVRDRFGNATVGRVILPREYLKQERLPLVITSYSCRGFLLGGSGRDVPEHVLAGRGYAAVCIDHTFTVVRKVPGYASRYENSQWSGLDFYEDAVRVLDQQGIVDPDRIMLTGFSGSTTNATFAITQSRMFTAASVSTQGSLDLIVCYLTANFRSCKDDAERDGFSGPYATSGYLARSPALNAEGITAPLLMQLPEVEYVAMLQLYSAMRDHDRAVEMFVFADAYHYKNQARQRLAVYERNLDWIDFWLRGQESTAPSRSSQNVRWRSLRERQCKLFEPEGTISEPPWYCVRH